MNDFHTISGQILADAVRPAPVNVESVIPAADQAAIAAHKRIRQLEIELAAEKATSDRLRVQRDHSRKAGVILMGKLREAQELVEAQALSLEQLMNRVRKADLALGKLTNGDVRA